MQGHITDYIINYTYKLYKAIIINGINEQPGSDTTRRMLSM